jgi:hypothetical protein
MRIIVLFFRMLAFVGVRTNPTKQPASIKVKPDTNEKHSRPRIRRVGSFEDLQEGADYVKQLPERMDLLLEEINRSQFGGKLRFHDKEWLKQILRKKKNDQYSDDGEDK